MRAAAIIERLGNTLLLQLMFVLCSLPILTAGVAAIALQRQLSAVARGERTGPASYLGEFRRTWSAGWQVGIAAALIGIGFGAGIPFWAAVPGAAGRLALCVLVFLGGLAAAGYLNLLRAAVVYSADGWRQWLAGSARHLVEHPIAALWGVVLLATWLALAGTLPTLILIGSGLVPAGICRLTLPQQARVGSRSAQATRS